MYDGWIQGVKNADAKRDTSHLQQISILRLLRRTTTHQVTMIHIGISLDIFDCCGILLPRARDIPESGLSPSVEVR